MFTMHVFKIKLSSEFYSEYQNKQLLLFVRKGPIEEYCTEMMQVLMR